MKTCFATAMKIERRKMQALDKRRYKSYQLHATMVLPVIIVYVFLKMLPIE